jgi:UTP--glucose-1-phosphate uridylyltransferase
VSAAYPAIVPVAGFGTRLLPLTRSVPKELLPLGRLPVLHHVMDEMAQAKVRRFVLVTSERKAAIRDYFSHSDAEYQPQFVDQPAQLGLGHAVLCARELMGSSPFFIALGDAVIHHRDSQQETLCQRMARLFNTESADAVVAFHEVPADRVSRYGVAAISSTRAEHFNVSGLVEKPAPADAPSHFAIAARYLCRPALFDLLSQTPAGKGGEIQLTDALQSLIDQGGRIIGVPLSAAEKRYDIGNFATYYKAVQDFLLHDDVSIG